VPDENMYYIFFLPQKSWVSSGVGA
jgi:hypothetical protein